MRALLPFTIFFIFTSPLSATEKIGSSQVSKSNEEVTRLAFAVLSKQINVDEKDIALIHLARINWPDSALGCPKPGIMYTQAIVSGHLAMLKHGGKQYRVHLGDDRGLICNLTRMLVNLDEVIVNSLRKMATQDLADSIGANVLYITVVDDQHMVWPDTNFGCTSGSDTGVPKIIRGHLIKLEYRGQIYEYRTSRTEVRPCPPIEVK